MAKDCENNELTLAGERICLTPAGEQRTDLRRLRRLTAARLKTIAAVYKKASLGLLPATKNGAAREWLCDNYYLFDREGKDALAALKSRRRLPAAADGLPQVYHIASALFSAAGKAGLDRIEAFLSGVQKRYILSNAELTIFRDMLSAAVIEAAADECAAIASADGGSAERISDCVGTLRAGSGADMSECIERLSVTEALLKRDPAGIYDRMSDDTKEYYRACVAEGAEKEGISEAQFAERALKKAESVSKEGAGRHVGFYVVPEREKTGAKAFVALYFAAPFAIAAALAALTRSVLAAAVLPFALWALWYAVQENIASASVKRRFVCSLDPEKLPPETRTTVVISCLVTSAEQIKRLAKNLLQVRLSGGAAHCGLLADLKESATASRPEDAHLLSVLEKEIRKLNSEFGGGFFAVVRKRSFSQGEGKYMGRERKRGAITEFIRYIDTGICDFASLTGDLKGVIGSAYLLTLDADTSLSINATAELTAVLEHPLNKAIVVDNKVISGFGIAVPRLTTDIESSSRSLFSRVFAGTGGLHSYGGSGADLYRDLFGDGLFTGKGLIDVKAFCAVIDGAFPENRVLSHDIIEGGALRACTVSGTELSDGFPTTVKAWLTRQSRWIRGDFQNAFFLRKKRRNERGESVRNEFGFSDRFKLFDNIRRGLTPIFVFVSAAVCVFSTLPFRIPLLALVLASVSAGDAVAAIRGLFKPRIAFRRYITHGIPAFLAGCARIALNVMMLPQLAAYSLAELFKAAWRTLISHKNMLEWVTAAEAENGKRNGMGDYYLQFRFSAALGVVSLFSGRVALAVLGALWMIAPAVLCEISRPSASEGQEICEEDEELLYSFAAAMWRFFDRYVNSETGFLPPDNVQYSPYRVAMRTSPTNIGLYLLCVLAARDLGFIDSAELCRRISDTLGTLETLEKWYGNLYNWYDLKTLEPLRPEYVSTVDSGNLLCCLTALKEGVSEYAWEHPALSGVAERCEKLLAQADISQLYNERRKLFYIGYDAAAGAFGNNMYDILMSEARMTSYYAVAKKVADKRHWGMLGRLFAGADGYVGPLSWTGTMFEYFMPHLLLPVVSDSLTDEALRYALYCQKKRTAALKLPWGVSESGFYSFDMGQNYQYKAFGVQKLGLKRGLDGELVISPYSTFLTLSFAPADSVANLKRLVNMGMNGEFGLYEAIDFTGSRTGGGFAVVKSYMAHHTGMSLVSVANCLLGNVMQKRFMRDADMRTAQKLLEEAVYDGVSLYKGVNADVKFKLKRRPEEGMVCSESDPSRPRALLLSNGEFSTVITDGGSGFSAWNGMDMSAWKRDLVLSPSGVYALLKENGRRAFSVTADPVRDGVTRRAEFSSASAVFTAISEGLEAAMSVSVHGRIPAEIRVIKAGNTERRRKEAELLIYAEPVLREHRAHAAHPAFSDLFLMCEYRASEKCLLVWRRGDVDEEACVAYGFADAEVDCVFETDRSAVLKKGRGVFSLPDAFDAEFSSAAGTPVVPCAAFRTRFTLRGGENRSFVFIQCAGRNREEALSRFLLIRRQGVQSMMKSSWEAAGNMSASLDCGAEENRLLGAILPRVFFDAPRTRVSAEAARLNTLGRRDLWSLSVSGDLPVVSCVVSGVGDVERALSHMKARRAAAIKGAKYDLCVIYSEGGAYDGGIRAALEEAALSCGGGVFLIDAEKAGFEKTRLLKAFSVYCDVCGGEPEPEETRSAWIDALPGEPLNDGAQIESFVPGGGFENDAFVAWPQKSSSPLPWCFPLANKVFGTLVSDSSLGFSYFLNSRLDQITPWSNDYMADAVGERLIARVGDEYRDLIRGAFVRFGSGYAEYRSVHGAVEATARVSVHGKLPAKTVRVSLRNRSDKSVALKLAYYTDPLPDGAPQRMTKVYERGGALFAENPFNDDYKGVTVCLSCTEDAFFVTGRESFFSGNWEEKSGVRERPCAAAIAEIKLKAGESATVRFRLSAALSRRAAAYHCAVSTGSADEVEACSGAATRAFEISTPSEDIDRLVNFYLPYQTKFSRVYARTGFSQNSGAYGFRDQLQDVCALLCADPALARTHILKAASAQFEDGDVLHWWHKLPKNSGGFKGVRTRCSDDLLWLPYAVSEYVSVTGEVGILSENVNFISGDNLRNNENERYITAAVSGRGSIYEHCRRALERGYRTGKHGLLLFGSGDWNDGMNRVGIKGRGESVWLTMFACVVFEKFAPLAAEAGDGEYSELLRGRVGEMKTALGKCFDGDRYIRGYHDDGSRLGAEECAECRIDAISQSFAVFAGLDRAEAAKAVETAIKRLTVKERNIVRLFDPPFRSVRKDVGYIKRYPAGIRENGGQYTHAAVWLAMAALRLGMADAGAEILAQISPITHSFEPKYKTEPYFLAADIYTALRQEGRGGWTIYTGAAAWYYRAVIEELLGLKKRGDKLYISPCVPEDWQQFGVKAELEGTRVDIIARRTGRRRIAADGEEVPFVRLEGGEIHVEAEF